MSNANLDIQKEHQRHEWMSGENKAGINISAKSGKLSLSVSILQLFRTKNQVRGFRRTFLHAPVRRAPDVVIPPVWSTWRLTNGQDR